RRCKPRDGVRQSWSLDGERNACAPSEPPVGRSHEDTAPFEVRQVKLNASLLQRIDQRKRRSTSGNAKGSANAARVDVVRETFEPRCHCDPLRTALIFRAACAQTNRTASGLKPPQ